MPLLSSLQLGAPSLISHRNNYPCANRFTLAKLHPRLKCSTGLHYFQVLQSNSFFSCRVPSSYDNKILDVSNSSLVVRARVAEQDAASDHPGFKGFLKLLDASWRFLRPYTIRGSIVASFSWALKAYILANPQPHPGHPMPLPLLPAVSALFAIICANGFIAGINQIYDIEIDKINKPYLPLAAGDLSIPAAWTLVISMAAAGLAVALANKTQPITISLYCFSLFLGALYSVPPLRLKRFPLGAYLVMAIVRCSLNFGLYFALKATVGFQFAWTAPMTFISTFSTVLCFVFGVIKDLPDVEGDREHQIPTLAVVLGPKNTTLLGYGVLVLLYVASIATAIFMPQSFKSKLMIPAHVILALSLGFQVWLLDKAKYAKDACLQFYMFLWNLYYVEYLMFPFM